MHASKKRGCDCLLFLCAIVTGLRNHQQNRHHETCFVDFHCDYRLCEAASVDIRTDYSLWFQLRKSTSWNASFIDIRLQWWRQWLIGTPIAWPWTLLWRPLRIFFWHSCETFQIDTHTNAIRIFNRANSILVAAVHRWYTLIYRYMYVRQLFRYYMRLDWTKSLLRATFGFYPSIIVFLVTDR